MGEYVAGILDPSRLPPGLRLPTPGSPQQDKIGSNFTSSDCGSVNGSAAGSALMPNSGWLAINGQIYLNGCIVGNDEAAVEFIELITLEDAEYAYSVSVYAAGPSGFGSGSLHLKFEDQTGDTYSLKIFLSGPRWHNVSYNSSAPGIVSVSWSD